MGSKQNDSSPTIVGGQPTGKRDLQEGSPRNIEKIVLDLASEDSFRRGFLEDRKRALSDAGIVLSPDEEKILGSISDGEILAMAGVLTPTREPSRRRFLRAAASLAALSGVGLLPAGRAGAEDIPGDGMSRGIRPTPIPMGIRPEEPEGDPPPKPTPTPRPVGGGPPVRPSGGGGPRPPADGGQSDIPPEHASERPPGQGPGQGEKPAPPPPGMVAPPGPGMPSGKNRNAPSLRRRRRSGGPTGSLKKSSRGRMKPKE